jgi:DNA-directed RNA polymerase subunit RPC12/RpoP
MPTKPVSRGRNFSPGQNVNRWVAFDSATVQCYTAPKDPGVRAQQGAAYVGRQDHRLHCLRHPDLLWRPLHLGCLQPGGNHRLAIIVLLQLFRPAPPEQIVQKIDLSGDIQMAKIKCKNCGADLDKESISVREGAIFISCPYCGSTYQMVEEPKW